MSPPPPAAALADIALADRPAGAPALTVALPVSVPAAVKDGTLLGIACILGSTLFFSSADIAAKALTDTVHPVQVAWMRYVIFLVVLFPVILLWRGPGAFVPRRPMLQIGRGLCVSVSAAFFIMGLQYLPVADNTAINYLSPLFITALSIPLLGEKVGPRRWAAAFVGFLGVLLVARPGSESFQIGALFPMAAAFIWGFGAIFTRMLADEAPETTLVWTGMVGFISMTVVVPIWWTPFDSHELGLGILNGLGSVVGHVFVVLAFRHASASLLAPFSYAQLVTATVLAYMAFGDIPGFYTVLGGLLIVGSGLYTAHRERVRRSEAATARRAA
ncbi:DMT family transporter [Mongoliimonas terrestris]|uniref:DMT family transporter n=1 Tax=Mongoliimonas terrestris TaxID=1709001 RepID=UPI000AF9D6C5|nr:DMT family transporter [Mongoliimonas terrestris]